MGRRHVATLMRKMGIEALYRRPNTSRKHPQHVVFPYLLSNGFEKFPGKIVEKFPDEWCGYGVSTAFFRCLNR